MKERIEVEVSEDGAGTRLDVFLAGRKEAVSRSLVQKLIEGGHVWVNGTVEKPSYRLRKGDIVSVLEPEPKGYDVIPEDIPLRIVYEDEAIVVVDKPAGMVVHPAAGHTRGTLVNALLFHCDDLSGIGGVMRPGIVHRLDKDTTGLIAVAKSDAAHVALAKQFKERLIKKAYKVLVFGDIDGDEGSVNLPVGRHPVNRKKMSTLSRRGKKAATRWKVLERYGAITLLEVTIETGRTHQIRVHLSSAGHPVLGDNVYGNSAKRLHAVQDALLRSKLKSVKRQALHAGKLGFFHPATNQYLELESPLPEDMAEIVAFLRHRD